MVNNGTPVGLINRFTKSYQRELHGRKSRMEPIQNPSLLVEKKMPGNSLFVERRDHDLFHVKETI